MQEYEFDITQTGYYVLVLYTDATEDADFVVGRLSLELKESHVSGIADVRGKKEEVRVGVYDLQGRRMANGQKPTAKGIYIHNGKKVVIR